MELQLDKGRERERCFVESVRCLSCNCLCATVLLSGRFFAVNKQSPTYTRRGIPEGHYDPLGYQRPLDGVRIFPHLVRPISGRRFSSTVSAGKWKETWRRAFRRELESECRGWCPKKTFFSSMGSIGFVPWNPWVRFPILMLESLNRRARSSTSRTCWSSRSPILLHSLSVPKPNSNVLALDIVHADTSLGLPRHWQ